MKDGRILLEKEYTNMDQMISWILSFGDKVEVIEPKEVREQITNIAEKMRKVYKGSKTNGKK
jgi:predicted DNA-binding transcriptional regulator YafY